jgi:hypothetical protein
VLWRGPWNAGGSHAHSHRSQRQCTGRILHKGLNPCETLPHILTLPPSLPSSSSISRVYMDSPASQERCTCYKHHCEAPASDEDTGHVSVVRRGCLMTAHCSRASCLRSARSSWPPTTTRRLLLRRQTSFISHLPLAQGTESTWQRFSVLSLASTFGCAGGQSHHPQLGLGTPNASAYHVRTIFPHALCRGCADT